MRCPAIIDAAARFLVTGKGYYIDGPDVGSHKLDWQVDGILWGHFAVPGLMGPEFNEALIELSELFPSRDPDAQD